LETFEGYFELPTFLINFFVIGASLKVSLTSRYLTYLITANSSLTGQMVVVHDVITSLIFIELVPRRVRNRCLQRSANIWWRHYTVTSQRFVEGSKVVPRTVTFEDW